MRLAAQAKGGFYPTPPRVVDLVAQLLYGSRGRSRSVDTLRVLDPCCGAGDALAQFADLLRDRSTVPVETCGVELHRERAEQAAQVLDRALACDLFATSIANNAFGVLLLNPPYDWDKEDKRVEHAFLTHTTRYLTDGGCCCSSFRSSASPSPPATCRPTTGTCAAGPSPPRNGRSSTRWRSSGGARASPAPTPTPRSRFAAGPSESRRSSRPGPIRSTTRRWFPPVKSSSPPGTVDPLAAVAEARKNGLWASQEVRDSLWPADDRRTRPLMPLRRGHMAMLVAAGFLDNLVLEADGQRILVKGRTTKEMVLAEETENTEVYRERLRTTVVALNLDGGEITDIAA